MPRLRDLLLCGAVAAPAACGTNPATPAEQPADHAPELSSVVRTPDNFEHKVDQYVRAYGHNWPSFRFHGVVAVYQHGEPILESAYGFSDLAAETRNDVETSFRLGSLSGPLTAAAVVRLSRDGTIDLDAPVTDYLPAFDRFADVRVEHLLTHTAGIENYTVRHSFDHFKREPRTTGEVLSRIAIAKRAFDPGTDYDPSNSNYALLGAVIEAATSRPHQEVVTQVVLEPLKMDDTRYGSSHASARGLTFNEAEYLETVDDVEPTAFGAAGGWTSNAADVAKFIAALSDDEFITPQERRRMLGDNAHARGYAWRHLGIGGRAGYAWPGLIDGFNSAVLWVPGDALTIIVLANTEVLAGGNMAADIGGLVYGVEPAPRVEPRPVPVAIESLHGLAGTYDLTAQSAHELEAGDIPSDKIDAMSTVFVALHKDALGLEVPGHGQKRMHPKGRDRFFFKDGPGTTARIIRGGENAKDRLWIEQGLVRLKYIRNTDATEKLATR